MDHDDTATGGDKRVFQSTLWTVVLTAKDPAAPDRRQALQRLIETYWKPVYLFIRRRGNNRETSKDLAQGFFTALLERNFLQYVQRDRGKFRTFLLTALEHFMADEHDRAQALKRGGGRPAFSLDFASAESEVGRDPAAPDSLDRGFRRDWALKVMSQSLQAVKREFSESGRAEEFEALRLHLSFTAREAPSYAEVAKNLGVSEGDVRNRIHRTRARYKEAILEVIRSYTETDQDAREELQDLLSAFA
ncbi:MAG TPA: sigma-70 family RNA polymerase sigma factor [Planctomycetota bacterium]|nr:sigma-70 family RNA polymerase sigma factor [Planctomycetota bacterium]